MTSLALNNWAQNFNRYLYYLWRSSDDSCIFFPKTSVQVNFIEQASFVMFIVVIIFIADFFTLKGVT